MIKTFYLTIKTENIKIKMEKTEFGYTTDFIGPYNYNIFILCGNTNRCKLIIAFQMT